MAAKSLFLYIVRTPLRRSEISRSFLKCADGTIRPIIRQGKIAQGKSPRVAVDTHGLTPVALIILKDFNFHLWHSTTDLRPWSSAVFDKKQVEENLFFSGKYWGARESITPYL